MVLAPVSWPRTRPSLGSSLSADTVMNSTERERSTGRGSVTSRTLWVVSVAVPVWTLRMPVSTSIAVSVLWIAAVVPSGVHVWAPSAVFSDTMLLAFDEVYTVPAPGMPAFSIEPPAIV